MDKISRREFLKLLNRGLTVAGLAAITAPVVAYFYPANLEEMPSEPVPVGPENELPVNLSKTVHFGRYPALIINTSAGLRAYSAVCTHFGCLVKWEAKNNRIACPCHQGYFDPVDGHVTDGPPPAPLTPLPVKLVDGQIYVGGEG